MKISNKKIFARELLILIGVISFTIILIVCLITYNGYLNYKADGIRKTTTSNGLLAAELRTPFKIKVENRTRFFTDLGIESKDMRATWDRLTYLIKSDSLEYRWTNVYSTQDKANLASIGFETPQQLKSFVLKNTITTKDLLDHKIGDSLFSTYDGLETKRSKLIDKMFYKSQIKDIAKIALIILTLSLLHFGTYISRLNGV